MTHKTSRRTCIRRLFDDEGRLESHGSGQVVEIGRGRHHGLVNSGESQVNYSELQNLRETYTHFTIRLHDQNCPRNNQKMLTHCRAPIFSSAERHIREVLPNSTAALKMRVASSAGERTGPTAQSVDHCRPFSWASGFWSENPRLFAGSHRVNGRDETLPESPSAFASDPRLGDD